MPRLCDKNVFVGIGVMADGDGVQDCVVAGE